MTATRDNEKESWQPGIAGFCGGAVSTMILLPLDNIKVRLQVNEGTHSKTISPISSVSVTSATTANYPSTNVGNSTNRLGAIRMLQGVIKHEGVRGLYQGMVPAILGSAVCWGGFFYLYENMKLHLIKSKSRNLPTHNNGQGTGTHHLVALNSWDNFFCSTCAGVGLVFVTNPVWLIKLRLQLQMKRTSENLHIKTVTQYDGFLDAFRKIVRSEGILGLYKGTGAALLLTSHGGVQFVVYEFLRKHFHYARAQRAVESTSLIKRFENSLGYLTIGAISKIVASGVTYPLQVMKSRMQQPSSFVELTNTGDVRVVKRDYTGLVATAQKMWEQEGIASFFKGAIPNAMRVAPSAAVTFLVYESIMDILQN